MDANQYYPNNPGNFNVETIKTKKIQTKWVVVVIVSLVLIIGAVGIWYYVSNFSKEATDQEIELGKEFPNISSQLDCNSFLDDSDVISSAANSGDITICGCLEDETKNDKCEELAKNKSYENQAVAQCNPQLCEQITDQADQESCIIGVNEYISTLDSMTLGICSLAAGDYHTSIIELEKLLNETRNANNLLNLAIAYVNKGQLENDRSLGDEALKLAEEAEGLEPEYREVHRVKGFIYELLGDYDNSLLSYNRSIEIDDTYYRAYSGRGHVYRVQGENDKALGDFEYAYQLNTESETDKINISLQICTLAVVMQNFEKSVDYCNQVIDSSVAPASSKVEAYISLSEMLYSSGRKKEALTNLEQAETINANNPNVHYALAKYHVFEQNLDVGINYGKKAIEVNEYKSAVYWILAMAYFGKGAQSNDYTQAVTYAEQGLEYVDEDISLLGNATIVMKNNFYNILIAIYTVTGDTAKVQEYTNLLNQ